MTLVYYIHGIYDDGGDDVSILLSTSSTSARNGIQYHHKVKLLPNIQPYPELQCIVSPIDLKLVCWDTLSTLTYPVPYKSESIQIQSLSLHTRLN